MAELFRHGIASGDPLADRFVIWTRVTTDNEVEPVRWKVALDPDLRDVVAEGDADARAEHDHTVKVDVEGLTERTTYYYAFEARGSRSTTGTTRTLPAGSVDRYRIAVTSCAKYTAGYFNAYAALADHPDVDLWLHLGDYIYEYPTDDGKAPGPKIGRPMAPDHECRTLEDYRTRYAHYRSDPDLQQLHARVPLIATIDDHEFCNDTWREGAKNHDEDEDGPWWPRREAALQAWTEWLPVRLDRDEPDQIFRDFLIGDLADLIVLDSRTQRDEMTKDREIMNDPHRTMLGPKQFEWAVDRMASSRGTWRLIAEGVMIGQVYTSLLPDELGDPLSEIGILTDPEHGPNPDQWDGYPAERARFFDAIRSRGLQDVVFVSGDVHSSWAVELRDHPEDEEDNVAVEFVTTSVTSENLDDEMGSERRTTSLDIEATVRDENPHVRFVELDNHGFMLLDVTRDRIRTEWHYVDDLHERSSRAALGAVWEVDRGAPALRRIETHIGTS